MENRKAVLVWGLSAMVDFAVAGLIAYSGFDLFPYTKADPAIVGALGVVCLSLAGFFHLKALHAE